MIVMLLWNVVYIMQYIKTSRRREERCCDLLQDVYFSSEGRGFLVSKASTLLKVREPLPIPLRLCTLLAAST